MKASTVTTTTLAVRPVLFSPEEELALVGYLAGYSGLTREAYALDLRQYVAWCTERHLALFGARRSDIETFGRHLESLGRGTRDDRTPAMHHHRVLPLRRRRRTHRHLAGGARSSAETRLRVQRHRLGP